MKTILLAISIALITGCSTIGSTVVDYALPQVEEHEQTEEEVYMRERMTFEMEVVERFNILLLRGIQRLEAWAKQ